MLEFIKRNSKYCSLCGIIITMQKKPTSAYVHIHFVPRFVIIVTFRRFYQESTGRCLSGTPNPGDAVL